MEEEVKPCFGKHSAGFDFCDDCPDEAKCEFDVIRRRRQKIGLCSVCKALEVFKNRHYCNTEFFDVKEKEKHHCLLINEEVCFCEEFVFNEEMFEEEDEALTQQLLKKLFGPNMNLLSLEEESD